MYSKSTRASTSPQFKISAVVGEGTEAAGAASDGPPAGSCTIIRRQSPGRFISADIY
jgi:hypothetical protein